MIKKISTLLEGDCKTRSTLRHLDEYLNNDFDFIEVLLEEENNNDCGPVHDFVQPLVSTLEELFEFCN
uniref:Ankyrin repeat domain-containing protein n=1 Tax=Strongyloides venezuelensis TaxID=75913 RepID=A0A0K0G574_STRVS